MKAFFANMHPSFSSSLNFMLQRAGAQVFTADQRFSAEIGDKFTNTRPVKLPGARQISHEEYLDLKPELAGHPQQPIGLTVDC